MQKILKFLSFVAVKTKEAFLNFPISMVLIVAGYGIAEYMNWTSQAGVDFNMLERLEMTIWVGLPLFTAISLFKMRQWTFFLALLLGAAYWFLQDGNVATPETMTRTMLWSLAFYSTLLFLPEWKKNPNNGFWVYCERLAFTLALGVLCMVILMISLQLALFSIRELFELNLNYHWESSVMIFCSLFFLPIFAHVGLPRDWKTLDSSTDYPVFLRPVAYYLLLPICVLYVGILTAYIAKILITMEWPSGQVAYPVVFLSLVIFATYFLSYPWQKSWMKYGFAILLPFLGVYFVALYLRINQYGITELRYLGVLLGILLAGLSIYYLVSKTKSMKLFFFSFAVVAFLSSFGPWGVFEVSVRSQVSHLEELLTEIGALQNGQLQIVSADNVDDKIEQEISGVVDYLAGHDRLDEVQAWTSIDLSKAFENYEVRNEFMSAIGLTFNMWGTDQFPVDPLFAQYNTTWGLPLDISGYDTLFQLDANYDSSNSSYNMEVKMNGEVNNLSKEISSTGELIVKYDESEFRFDLFALKDVLDEQNLNRNFYEFDPGLMTLTDENDDYRAKILIESISFNFTDETQTAVDGIWASGKFLLDVK